jgi:nucleotide-binding universal stress UspA family protein
MSIQINSVLVATDFSENAAQAVDTAIAIAKTFGAKMELVHAFQTPVPIVSPYEVVVPDGFLEQARDAAAQNLKAVVEKISAEGVEVRSHLTEVPAAPAIARIAEENDVDLVVMGTRGNTGLKHVLLGSVAERTIRLAPCSVLTVKPKDD